MINPKILTFLKGIKQNNHKEWYEENKHDYKELRTEFISLIDELADIVASFDKDVAQAQKSGKKICKVFRIHRDARFSHGKSKYKTNISGYISADVKDPTEPVYYLSIEAGKSFLGGGIHFPERLHLNDLRDYIQANPKKLKAIENDPAFRKAFPELLDRTKSLKTAPRGFETSDPAIEYLRLGSFTAGKSIANKELYAPGFKKQVIEDFKALQKLNKFLRDYRKANAHRPVSQEKLMAQYFTEM